MENSNEKNEQIKQVVEGLTSVMRTVWNNPDLTVPKDIAEKYDIDKKFCEKKENSYHTDIEIVSNGNCMICGKPLSGNKLYVCEECKKRIES